MVLAWARPSVDLLPTLAERWRESVENVHLWAGGEGLFGIFIANQKSTKRLQGRLAGDAGSLPLHFLEVPCRQWAVPVYFDFEMAWVRATGLSGVSEECPRGLPEPPIGPDDSPQSLPSPAQCSALRGLLEAPQQEASPAGRRWRGFERGIEGRGQRHGWIEHRSLLDPRAVAETVTGFPSWCTLVGGSLLESKRPPELFRTLVAVARVSPFLFASDGKEVLFAALSRGPGVQSDSGRSPVLSTLQSCVRNITVMQWPLTTLRALVSHRYLPALGPVAAGEAKRG
ncbi:MAG TPA: hypothetical protein VGS23_00825 [Thermoplasmata archaeon]|nr:hypothetical protein [Thermoplasmata archaeon]